MTTLAFIIPAYNEESFIGETIDSIRANIPDDIEYDLIVVDHGSDDRTQQIAISKDALVLSHPNAGTISELRNIGASHTNSDYLIFVDADTSLSSDWKNNISPVLKAIENYSDIITGSKRIIPDNSSWFNKAWFYSPQNKYSPGHLGGGHMIIPRDLFNKIGGFSTEFETGEDFEICQRARKQGAKIVSHPELRAIHRGIPASLKEYFSREVWHGRGDSKSISLILSSNVSIISILFFLLHTLFALSLIFITHNLYAPLIFILLIFLICFASAIKKSNMASLKILLGNTFLFYIYYWARIISIFDTIKNKNNLKRSRFS